MKTTYNLIRSMSNQDYRELIQFIGDRSSKFQFVVRNPKTSKGAMKMVKRLSKHLIREDKYSEWPGTKLLTGSADVYLFRTNAESCKLLEQTVENLYKWTEPNLPEDLAFLDENGDVILGSISHESDAWVSLETSEAKKFYLKFHHIIVQSN